MTEAEQCRHSDCIYHTGKGAENGCNYILMTGKSRIGGLPWRLTLPCHCPRYVPDGTSPVEIVYTDWRDEALRLYRAGATDREIADALGLLYNRVNRWRRESRLPRNADKRGPEVRFDWTRAEDLYRHGASDSDIARALGCCVSTVWRWRYKYELFPNRKRKRKAEDEKNNL